MINRPEARFCQTTSLLLALLALPRVSLVTLGPQVTSIPDQFVEVRGLVGDVNNDGFVNAVDRAVVVGAWTGPGGFTCATDLDGSG